MYALFLLGTIRRLRHTSLGSAAEPTPPPRKCDVIYERSLMSIFARFYLFYFIWAIYFIISFYFIWAICQILW